MESVSNKQSLFFRINLNVSILLYLALLHEEFDDLWPYVYEILSHKTVNLKD